MTNGRSNLTGSTTKRCKRPAIVPFVHSTHCIDKYIEGADEPVLELKTPLWFKIIWPLAIVAGIYGFILPHIMRVVTFGVASNASAIIANILVIGIAILFVGQGAVRMWHESGFTIRADTQGITLTTRSEVKHVNWQQITSCSEELRNEKGKLGQWITLRDEHYQVLLQWDKNWYRFTPHSIKRFDEFTQFVQSKVAEMNRR